MSTPYILILLNVVFLVSVVVFLRYYLKSKEAKASQQAWIDSVTARCKKERYEAYKEWFMRKVLERYKKQGYQPDDPWSQTSIRVPSRLQEEELNRVWQLDKKVVDELEHRIYKLCDKIAHYNLLPKIDLHESRFSRAYLVARRAHEDVFEHGADLSAFIDNIDYVRTRSPLVSITTPRWLMIWRGSTGKLKGCGWPKWLQLRGSFLPLPRVLLPY